MAPRLHAFCTQTQKRAGGCQPLLNSRAELFTAVFVPRLRTAGCPDLPEVR
jgi:hypothetical protein